MSITVLIPSYRRPHVLKVTIPSWLNSQNVRYLAVVADSLLDDEIRFYEEVLTRIKRQARSTEIIYELYKGKRGSANARNRLLDIASKLDADYAVMVDDDYILPRPFFLTFMAKHMERNESVGAVGGRVIMYRRRSVDPDFFLNISMNIADALTRVTGFVFLNTIKGPRYAEFLTPFYMLRKDVLEQVRYDPLFQGTGYREESDVHMQIRRLGYKLILDPRVYVLHLGLEEGGNRPPISMARRMYWKARNHTIFVRKHFDSLGTRLWYLFSSTLILSTYRLWYIPQVLKGVSDGLKISLKALARESRNTLPRRTLRLRGGYQGI